MHVKKLENLENYVGKFDWIVLEPPSTMTGLLRKVPDMKIRFSLDELKRKTEIQEVLINESMKYLSKNGKLVYSTSSLLDEENILQAAKACSAFDLEVFEGKHFQSFPDSSIMDGYFSITLKRKNN